MTNNIKKRKEHVKKEIIYQRYKDLHFLKGDQFINLLLLPILAFTIQSCSVFHTDISNVRIIKYTGSISPVVDGQQYFLPTGRLHINIRILKNGMTTIKHNVSYEADLRYSCILRYRDNWLFDDKVKVSLNEKGLLESVSFAVEDKTPAIVSNLSETAANVIQLAAMVAGGPEEVEYDLDKVIDPTNVNDISSINSIISKYGLNIDIKPDGWVRDEAGVNNSTPKDDKSGGNNPPKNEADGNNFDGLLYKQKLPYIFTIESTGKDLTTGATSPIPINKGIFQAQLYLPNESPIVLLESSRASFTKKEDTFTFNNGSLIKDDLVKGSQVLGFSFIPLELSKKALEIPEKLLTIRIKNLNNALLEKTRPLDDQKAILDKQTALEKALKENQDANNKELQQLKDELAILQAETALKKARKENAEADAALNCSQTPKPPGCL